MKTINLTIIIGLVLFILGIGIGFLLRTDKKPEVVPVVEQLTAQKKAIRTLLESRILDSICANLGGEVIEVREDTIIIMQELDALEIKVDPQAHIVRLLPPTLEEPNVLPITRTIYLDQIKQREFVSIYATITEQGEVVAHGISVLAIN